MEAKRFLLDARPELKNMYSAEYSGFIYQGRRGQISFILWNRRDEDRRVLMFANFHRRKRPLEQHKRGYAK
jgi:hypothetical protein